MTGRNQGVVLERSSRFNWNLSTNQGEDTCLYVWNPLEENEITLRLRLSSPVYLAPSAAFKSFTDSTGVEVAKD